MSQFTSQWLATQQAKRMETIHPSAGAVERESDLHDEIAAYCKLKGWYYVHSRMDRPTSQNLGVADFIIATNGGNTLWIEAKAKRNKPTREQLAAKCWLEKLGHEAHIVWSMPVFLDILAGME